MPERPNLILITTDQQRADCLSLAGHPDLTTPNLDELAHGGAWFRQAYSPAPICSPARRSILTGRSPATDGCTDNSPVRIPKPEDTLPDLLRRAGYQTAEIGRSMHQYPGHARYGFEVREHSPFESHDSHAHWVIRQTSKTGEFSNWPHLLNHGMPLCGYGARPWPYDEAFHQTTWTVNKAIEFADRRDADVPFFAHIGFVAPHPPLVPPRHYYERYARRELRPPVIGDWALEPENGNLGAGLSSGFIPDNRLVRDSMAGYYGLINHVDDMLFNLLMRFRNNLPGPTYFLFCSDHGEMLGDHHMFRKCRPYQGSIHVPFILRGPDIPGGTVCDAPVTLEDILPTLCELAGVDVPDHVEGRSVLPLLRGGSADWRRCVHSEQPHTWAGVPGFHCLTDGKWKYIWFSDTGREQLFDLAADPRELHDLSRESAQRETLEKWRSRLIRHIADRGEGFVRDGELVAGRPHPGVVAHARAV